MEVYKHCFLYKDTNHSGKMMSAVYLDGIANADLFSYVSEYFPILILEAFLIPYNMPKNLMGQLSPLPFCLFVLI